MFCPSFKIAWPDSMMMCQCSEDIRISIWTIRERSSPTLEEKFSVRIRKGPEFASDLPPLLKNIEKVDLSCTIPANKLFEHSGETLYNQIVQEQYEIAKENLGPHTFYINREKSDLIIGRNLPPPIIAEIVNCTSKSDKSMAQTTKSY